MERVAASTAVAIALGSNLGDRRRHLEWAVEELGRHLGDLVVSTPIETDPDGVPEPQPPYLNAALIGTTVLGPEPLLSLLRSLEARQGRQRLGFRAPRTLDLDLILYGDRAIDTPALVVPHPRFRERLFVLEPLAEIAPDWKDPVTGRTVRELRDLRREIDMKKNEGMKN